MYTSDDNLEKTGVQIFRQKLQQAISLKFPQLCCVGFDHAYQKV